jgi:hypothetical protein
VCASIKKVESLGLAAADYKVRMRAGGLINENGRTSCSQVLIKCIERKLIHWRKPICQGEAVGGAEFKKTVAKCGRAVEYAVAGDNV